MEQHPASVATERLGAEGASPPIVTDDAKPKGFRFHIALFSLCLIGFTSSLDGSILATALPRIVNEVTATSPNDYVWIANCFLLAQTVVRPPLAQICNIFGRRAPMPVSLALFALGSGIAGGSDTAQMLIAGRTVQGLGAGGIMLLIEVIVCDLVPMRERGKYLGAVLSLCAVGAVLGPLIGGVLAERSWRWVFYLNLPITGSVLLSMAFTKLRYNREPTWRHALTRVDWVGSTLFIGWTCAILLGLVFGGARHSIRTGARI